MMPLLYHSLIKIVFPSNTDALVLVSVDWWRKVHLKAFCRWDSFQFVLITDWLYFVVYILHFFVAWL